MERIVPKQVIVEATSRCNLKCRYCPRNDQGGGADMDVDFFKSIIDRVDFPTVIIPWANGEPLLHPQYAEMVKYITDRELPMYITTNGMLWNEALFDLITWKTSCYQLIFSLDGLFDSSSPSIEKARPGSNRATIERTIFRLMEKNTLRGSNLTLATKICMRGQDWEEVERYIDFWLRAGIDYVCVGKQLIDDATPGMRTAPCQYFDNNFMVIRHDGKLVACAYNDDVVNHDALPLGYVDETTPLLDLYNNEAYTALRQRQNARDYPGPCRTCGFAYTGRGMQGMVTLRDPSLIQQPLYFHADHYNSFFSLKRDWKAASYYAPGVTQVR